MGIGETILACFVTGWIILMIVMLIDNERERKHIEMIRRRKIRWKFEEQMYNLREYGNINGKDVRNEKHEISV